ncbi:MAG TPA: serine/threonine-protein kinase [Kofleriaceae bacterium]|nr:serine/threonine-protein kinase [Kofleriaceae bacterium]
MSPHDPSDQAHADTLAAGAPSTGGAPRQVVVAATALDDAAAARYRHDRQLGRGGMGEVLLADDQRIGRQVALKTLRERARGDAGATARFLREARVQGQLEHPAIVPVYDLGAAPDGTPFFTMKRLRGMTLEQLLARLGDGDGEVARAWSLRKLLAAFAQASQAVHFAHTRGVVHRDLKPSNIMLGDFGEIYVLDWGVARLAGVADETTTSVSTGDDDTEKTAYGSVIGTPGYMAPEQLRGEVDHIDGRSDVYALGAILFEILTLRPLHDRSTTESVTRSTLDGADARAAARAPDREVAPELEAICVRATALAAADRFATAAELVGALERYLDGDRDLARRRELAAEHAAAAADACARGLATDDARKQALREAGRALALDPGNEQAIGVMSRLFLEPPAQVPAEVEAELRHRAHKSSRREAMLGVVTYLAVIAFGPIYLWMGVTSWPYFIAMGAIAVVMGVQAYVNARSGTINFVTVQVAILGYAVLLVLISRSFGPFIAVPTCAALGTAFFLFHGSLQKTPVTIGLGCLAVAAPVVLEELGVFARTYEVSGETLHIRSDMLHLSPGLTLFTLTAISVVSVLAGGLFMLDIRRSQENAERQLMLQAWQLRQLVPEQTLLDSPR